MSELPILTLPSGVSVQSRVVLGTDWDSIRTLIESGVPAAEAARHYKLSIQDITRKSKQEQWLTPTRAARLRKDIATRQAENFRRAGSSKSVEEVKAQVWLDRNEEMKEESYRITKSALKGVTDAQAKHFIRNPKGLLEVVQAVRLITGEEKRDAQDVPQLAVSIGLLSRGRPTQVAMEAELVDEG